MVAAGGHSADSPSLMEPSGAITGVQNLPADESAATIPVTEFTPWSGSSLELAHFGPIVFQLSSE